MYYSKEHIWVKEEENAVKLGITNYAQEQLGDVVYLELREEGKIIRQGESFGSIESVKSVSALIAPIDLKVNSVNNDLVDDPDIVNQDPEGEAWLIEAEPADKVQLKDLLTKEAYIEFTTSQND